MMPAPAGSEPGGFEMGPEVYLLVLGVIATVIVVLVFVWLLRGMIKEDREARVRDVARGAETKDLHE